MDTANSNRRRLPGKSRGTQYPVPSTQYSGLGLTPPASRPADSLAPRRHMLFFGTRMETAVPFATGGPGSPSVAGGVATVSPGICRDSFVTSLRIVKHETIVMAGRCRPSSAVVHQARAQESRSGSAQRISRKENERARAATKKPRRKAAAAKNVIGRSRPAGLGHCLQCVRIDGALYRHFFRIQKAVGIRLTCTGEHDHTDWCHW